jgi:hypothetical protein
MGFRQNLLNKYAGKSIQISETEGVYNQKLSIDAQQVVAH